MSLEELYQQYAGGTDATQWTPDTMSCPPRAQAETRMVETSGHHGPHGHYQTGKQEFTPQQVTATSAEIAVIIGGLKASGRSLGLVEALARDAMAQLTREAAAELVVVLDDAFAVAPDATTARIHCQRLLNDPAALQAFKAKWSKGSPRVTAL